LFFKRQKRNAYINQKIPSPQDVPKRPHKITKSQETKQHEKLINVFTGKRAQLPPMIV
jgi:hypothetical protein